MSGGGEGQFSLFEAGAGPEPAPDRGGSAAADAGEDGAGTSTGGRDGPASAAGPEGSDAAPETGGGPPGPGDDAPAGPAREAAPAPGASAETALAVSELNAAARRVLEESFPPLWVAGEVADWTRAQSGHCYFTLRDESAQLSCVMWRRHARRLPTEPEEGMEVSAFGEVSLYEDRGDYQLLVRRLEARGEGLWRLAFERLKRKLASEGLLDDARKRPLPRVPLSVGVVTSRTGAAVRDVVSVVRRRAPWTRIVVSDCRVQGEQASGEIVRALERLVEHDAVDVIVLTRGGGSVEDLWAFNEEEVARAVAACPVPVVSAVGHEVDVSISDLVADRRAPTPSAAGELVVPDGEALRADLRRIAEGLVSGLRGRTRTGRERARRAAERLVGGVERRLERWEGRLERLGGRLDALSPLGTLERGFAVPLDEGGRVLRRVADFAPGDDVELRVVDGRVGCRVRETGTLEEEG